MKILYFTIVLLCSTLHQSLYALTLPTPLSTSFVTSADQTRIAVQEWGNPNGKAIVLSHAWSQHHLGWLPVLQDSSLLSKYHIVTYDLRGHGDSDKPNNKTAYNNGDVWADDLHAVITQRKLSDVTLVGWSYGTIVIADYIKKYGEKHVHAINMVAGLSGLNVSRIGHYFGNGFQPGPVMSKESSTQSAGILNIVDIMVPADMDKRLYALLVATNMVVPPYVRAAMLDRQIDHKATYKTIQAPVLFTHGGQDNAIKTIAAEEGSTFTQHSKVSIHKAANHGPHWFDSARFNRELDTLITQGL